MRTAALVVALALAAGCSHTRVEISANSNTTSPNKAAPTAGTSISSGSSGLQVRSTSPGFVAAIAVMAIIAGAADYARDPQPLPSPAVLLPENSPAVPALAPERRVSEQDCTRPIDFTAGNIRCK